MLEDQETTATDTTGLDARGVRVCVNQWIGKVHGGGRYGEFAESPVLRPTTAIRMHDHPVDQRTSDPLDRASRSAGPQAVIDMRPIDRSRLRSRSRFDQDNIKMGGLDAVFATEVVALVERPQAPGSSRAARAMSAISAWERRAPARRYRAKSSGSDDAARAVRVDSRS